MVIVETTERPLSVILPEVRRQGGITKFRMEKLGWPSNAGVTVTKNNVQLRLLSGFRWDGCMLTLTEPVLRGDVVIVGRE